jgi:hypothetical protein
VFTLNEKSNSLGSTNSLWWDTAEVDLKGDEGIYVEIDKFMVKEPDGNYQYPSNLLTKVAAMRKAGLIKKPVYGFKKDRLAKLGKGWVKLEDHLKETLAKLVKDKGLAQDMADYNAAAGYKHIFDDKHYKLMPPGSLARTWLDEQYRMMHPKTSLVMIAYVQSKGGEPWLTCPTIPTPSTDLNAEEQKIMKRYPMITLWDSAQARSYGTQRFTHVSEDEMKTFAEYVRLVESK